jgi:uncharacterized protein (UPF0548 family)
MFCLLRPSAAALHDFLARQQALPFTYEAVGASRAASAPPDYRVNHGRQRLGQGEAAFAAACEALRRWEMFNVGFLQVAPATAPIEVGSTVGMLAGCGIWSVNACRIVYVVSEPNRFGFGYGTLPGHIARGEERFLIERDADGTVWYDVWSFSRPRHPLAWLGLPALRLMQKMFARASAAAMLRAVEKVPLDKVLS